MNHIPPALQAADPSLTSAADVLTRLAGPPPASSTFEEVLARVPQWERNPKRAQTWMARLRTAALIAKTGQRHRSGRRGRVRRRDVDYGRVPFHVPWLNEHLFVCSAATCGLSPDAYRDAISAVRWAGRQLGIVAPRPVKLRAESPWRTLLAAVDSETRFGLFAFAFRCDTVGITPWEVRQAHLDAFADYARHYRLNRNVFVTARNVAKAWRLCARKVPDWPSTVLAVKSRRDYYVPAVSALPSHLQGLYSEFKRHLERADTNTPFSEDGNQRRRSQGTVRARLFSFRQILAALPAVGRSFDTIQGFGDLVDGDTFKSVTYFYWERSRTQAAKRNPGRALPPEAGVTAQTSAIAATLMIIAKECCVLPAEVIERLARLARDMTPKQPGTINPKVRNALAQFDDKQVLAALLHLPQHLIDEADAINPVSVEAARTARTAVALELLLQVPLRITNLVMLRFDVQLLRDSPTSLVTRVVITGDQTKNGQDLELSIGETTGRLLEHYSRRYLPRLCRGKPDWLFPASINMPGHLQVATLRPNIVDTVHEEVGATVWPHLFRALAVKLRLEDDPNAIEDMRQLLGDKLMSVVLAHYAPVNQRGASRRQYALIEKLRAETRHLAAKAPSVKRRRSS